MKIAHFAAMLLLFAMPVTMPAWGQALPVLSDTGPDAAAFGAAEGYPVGTRKTLGHQNTMVGTYSHFDQILPSNPVPRAATPAPFQRAPAELALTYPFRGATHTLDQYLDRHPATGLLIVRDRTIMFEHYRYGRTPQDRFTSQSMAKTVLAMLVGIAIDEGKIRSIDDSAAIYVPELADTELGRTPIRALLTMTSGLAFTELYNGHDDMAKMSHALFRPGSAGAANVLAQFGTREAAPGTVWHYAGRDSELLGLVLADAVRMPLAQYLSTRIWQRIGTEADASWLVDATGQEAAFCCVNATLRDWARFGLLLANDGAWDGQQVIPRQWVLDATTAAPPGSVLAPGKVSRRYGYGYQTWILNGKRREFALIGVHGQMILVDPALKLVLVHMAVRPNARADATSAELLALWNALVAQQQQD
jgi:CubicO group peptidase (beta-lactamase class C family)